VLEHAEGLANEIIADAKRTATDIIDRAMLIKSRRETCNAALDGYEKTIASFVDFRQQLVEATQLDCDWVTAVVKAQNDFPSKVNAAYKSAAREVLK
jgi:hypothetical protein